MPTKLSQTQVEGLPEEIQSLDSIDVSLEAKISTEDSQNDQVDINLQGQIDNLKSVILSLVFGDTMSLMLDEGVLYAQSPKQVPIAITAIDWEWYLEAELISGAIYDNYTPTQEGSYTAKVTYTTQIGIKQIESFPVYVTPK